MKIYFACAITAGRQDAPLYAQIVDILKSWEHNVLSEMFVNPSITTAGDTDKNYAFERDCKWIRECDAIVAEVSTPSLGIGYELGYGDSLAKKLVCLYRKQEGRTLSGLLRGNPRIMIIEYQTVDDLSQKLKEALG